MNLVKTSSCAIHDINELRAHKTPKEAMIAFCKQAILERPMFGPSIGVAGEIFSFYLFTAAVGPAYPPYGQAFYEFILANKLGEVWQSPRRWNKAWHPDHENQVYVWMPDKEAVKKWWAENNPNAPKKPEKKKIEPEWEDKEADVDDYKPMPVPLIEADIEDGRGCEVS